MISKDGEEVAFFKACLCDGQVGKAVTWESYQFHPRLKNGWRGWCRQCRRQSETLWCRSQWKNMALPCFQNSGNEHVRADCSRDMVVQLPRPGHWAAGKGFDKIESNCSSQVSLTGTQIWWTSEVLLPFEVVDGISWFRSARPSRGWRRVLRIRWRIITRSRSLSSTTSSLCCWATSTKGIGKR